MKEVGRGSREKGGWAVESQEEGEGRGGVGRREAGRGRKVGSAMDLCWKQVKKEETSK